MRKREEPYLKRFDQFKQELDEGENYSVDPVAWVRDFMTRHGRIPTDQDRPIRRVSAGMTVEQIQDRIAMNGVYGLFQFTTLCTGEVRA